MTNEMTVQQQRPSAVPYLLTGAAVGAGGGAALAKWTPYAVKTQYGKTWEEAVAKTNADDKFVKEAIAKGGENKAHWETIQTQAAKVQAAEKALKDSVPEALHNDPAFTEYLETMRKAVDTDANLVNQIREGKIAVEGKTKEELAKMSTEEIEALKEYENEAIKFMEECKSKAEALAKKITEANGSEKSLKKIENLSVKYLETCSEANETLSKDVLKACKKPSMKWTALAGAAALGLGALLFRPKAKDS